MVKNKNFVKIKLNGEEKWKKMKKFGRMVGEVWLLNIYV